MKKMTKKEKLLKRDLIECKILNCIDNAKACYCSQAGSWRAQAAAKRMSSAQLIFQGLFTQNFRCLGQRQARGRSFSSAGVKGHLKGTESHECLDWIAEETGGVSSSELLGYKQGVFWPIPEELKV